MRRWLWLLLAFATAASAQAKLTPRSWTQTTACAAGTCTRAAPSTTPTFNAGAGPGLYLQDVGAVDILFCAPSGETLSGSGTLLAWVYDGAFGVWARYPAGDLAITVAGGTARCQIWNDQVVGVRRSRWLTWVPSGVTVSGSSNGNVTLQSFGSRALQ